MTTKRELGPYDLDVDSPEQVPKVLREVADRYRESAHELDVAHQDKRAGRPWRMIAGVFDKAAATIDKKLERMHF